MFHRIRRAARLTAAYLSLVVLAFTLTGCAAKTINDKARVGALVTGKSVLTISSIEQTLYESNSFDKATHDKLGKAIIASIDAALVYDRLAMTLPENSNTPLPSNVVDARRALNVALEGILNVVPPNVRPQFIAAIDVVRSLLLKE